MPLSEQYRIVAKQYIEANAAADILEELKSATLSQMMQNHASLPVSRAEMMVKSSSEWTDYINSMVEARKTSNLKKAQLEWIRMKFSEQQSREATERAERRL